MIGRKSSGTSEGEEIYKYVMGLIPQTDDLRIFLQKIYLRYNMPVIVTDIAFHLIAYGGPYPCPDPLWQTIITSGAAKPETVVNYYFGEGFTDKMSAAGQPIDVSWGVNSEYPQTTCSVYLLRPKQYVGFKYFNVYGPNEYFKGSMASVIFHTFNKIKETGEMGLFKSYRPDYEDGQQLRDFVYVKDICKVVKFMIENPAVNGLFNLGTGTARSFYDLAKATFTALGLEPNIKFVDMPESLRAKYQYYTQADMQKLRDAGYQEKFYSLEEGCRDYVVNYLAQDYKTY